MYILGKQAHYSGAAGMECDRTEKRKSELEQVAGILLRHANCRAQREPHGSVTPARDLLGLLVDRLEDGVVMIGPDQTVVWLNSAMERLFGVSGYETIGMNAVEFISHCISPCLMSGEALKEDFIVSCSFGEDIPVRRYCIIRNPDNRIRVDYSSTVIPKDRTGAHAWTSTASARIPAARKRATRSTGNATKSSLPSLPTRSYPSIPALR